MPKNIYQDKSAKPKSSSAWEIPAHPSNQPRPPPEPITPPAMPEVPYERAKREGTINKHAQDLLRKSRENQ